MTMSLHIPKALREEMNKHPNINWSRVAQEAFRKEMGDPKIRDHTDDYIRRLVAKNKELLEEVSWLKHDLARIKKSIRRVLGADK